MVCIGLSINGLEYSIISCQDANREIAIAAITPRTISLISIDYTKSREIDTMKEETIFINIKTKI